VALGALVRRANEGVEVERQWRDNRGAVGAEGWGMERRYPPQSTRSIRERRELPTRVRGKTPAANGFGAFWALRTTLVALKILYYGSLVVVNCCASSL
jgi:hypothetical protein